MLFDEKKDLFPLKSCFLGYTTKGDIGEGAASGGFITSFLIFLLENNLIDGALVSRIKVEDGKLKPFSFIAATKQELLSSQGSIYMDFPLGQALSLLKNFNGRVAVVGLPCFLKILEQMNLQEKIAFKIGVFCSHNCSEQLIYDVFQKNKVNPKELSSFRFRKGHWRGQAVPVMKNGQVLSFPFLDFYGLYMNLYFHKLEKCLSCDDLFSRYADISAGDAWMKKIKKHPKKHSLLIIRTDRGEHLFNQFKNKGYFKGSIISSQEVLWAQKRGLNTKKFVHPAAKRLVRFFGFNSAYKTEVNPKFYHYVPAFLMLSNMKLSRSGAMKFIMKIPRPLLYLYVIFIKLFLNSYQVEPQKRDLAISTIAATLTGNKGSSAMLYSVVDICSSKYDALFNILSYYPTADRIANPFERVDIVSGTPKKLVSMTIRALFIRVLRALNLPVPSFFLSSGIRAIERSAVVLVMGGTTFSDSRPIMLVFNVACLLPALLLKKKIIMTSQAMGPFKTKLNRFVGKLVLKRVNIISARGVTTAQSIKSLGLNNVIFQSDLAFSLQMEGYDFSNIESKYGFLKQKKTVGISPSSVVVGLCQKKGVNYAQLLAWFADFLVEKGYQVVLIPHSVRYKTEKTHNNDFTVVSDIMQLVKDKDKVIVVNEDYNPRELRYLIGLMDFYITSRFHAMISALSEVVPCLVFGWGGHKYTEVMQEFGLKEYVFDAVEMDKQKLMQGFSFLEKNREEIKGKIKVNLIKAKASSRQILESIDKLIDF